MRTRFLSVVLFATTTACAQPDFFSGSFEMGLGPSVLIDNQDYNTGVGFGFLGGISVSRNLNQTTSLQTGFYYSRYTLGYTFSLSDESEADTPSGKLRSPDIASGFLSGIHLHPCDMLGIGLTSGLPVMSETT